MHRADQRFPRHHLLRLYRSEATCHFKTDPSFVIMLHLFSGETSPNHLVCLCDAAGLHVFPTFVLYELTILLVLTLSLVIMKVQHLFSSLFMLLSFCSSPFFHTLSPSSLRFTPRFPPSS